MSRAVDMHYTATEVALLVRKCPRYVRDRMRRGDFGPDTFFIDGEYVASASAVNAWLECFRVVQLGIAARSEGEYRRKAIAAAAKDGGFL